MEKYTVLYNPLADNGKGKENAENLTQLLPDAQLEFIDKTEITDFDGFFKNQGDTPILIAGGDGTLNRFINDTSGIEFTTPVYFYPAGSGNDFLRDLGLNKGDKPVKINDYLKDLPIVEVNGKTYKFINNVGFGIDGYCCEVGDKLKAKSNKPVNYTSIAIKGLLFNFKTVNATVTVDGVEKKYKHVWLAPTMNGRYYGGGMMPTPNQDRLNKDGTLSVMIMFKRSKLKTLMVFPSIFKGEHVKHTEMVEVLTGKEINVKFDRPTSLQIDGETILAMTEYTAKSVR